ncbi:MAG: hypothetical protein K6T73_07210 [Candidatus Bathyarchaeota archaeon]|nr:hypothetical protein [Candidatus Bathyarchaeota archaeon]
MVQCPKCGEKAVKHGKRDGIQRYRCVNKHVFQLEKPQPKKPVEQSEPLETEYYEQPEQQAQQQNIQPQQEDFITEQPEPEPELEQPKQPPPLPPTPLHIFTPEYNPFVKWLFDGITSWTKLLGLIRENNEEKQQKEYI